MAVGLHCAVCGEFVCLEPENMSIAKFRSGNLETAVEVDCPGPGNEHPNPYPYYNDKYRAEEKRRNEALRKMRGSAVRAAEAQLEAAEQNLKAAKLKEAFLKRV